MEWLKGQAELEGPEEVKDMVSVRQQVILVKKDTLFNLTE